MGDARSKAWRARGVVRRVQCCLDMERTPRPACQMDAVHGRLRAFRLRVTRGPDVGRAAASVGGELSVGTARANQLALTDPTVSRHHLAVRCTEVGYWVRDLGSTNGILVGSRRVQLAAISDGCALAIGGTRVVFELLDELTDRWAAVDALDGDAPPLCERRDDIPGLVAHFYRQLTDGEPPPALIRTFVRRTWPGDVRELRTAVERAVRGDPWDRS